MVLYVDGWTDGIGKTKLNPMSKPYLAWADQTQPAPAGSSKVYTEYTEYSRCSRIQQGVEQQTDQGSRMAGGATLNFNIGVLGHVDRSDYNWITLVGVLSEAPDLQQKYWQQIHWMWIKFF